MQQAILLFNNKRVAAKNSKKNTIFGGSWPTFAMSGGFFESYKENKSGFVFRMTYIYNPR